MEKLLKLALFAVLVMMLFPLGAASEDSIPYIKITNPMNGSSVSGVTPIEFRAEGVNLRDPFLTISGSNGGVMGLKPTMCAISQPLPEKPDNSEDPSIQPMPMPEPPLQSMHCTYKWDSANFEGQKVTITATVYEQSGKMNNNVVVLVSGQCA